MLLLWQQKSKHSNECGGGAATPTFPPIGRSGGPTTLQTSLSDKPLRTIMTESTTAEVQQLVQQGRAAALAGDTFAARTSFRRATEIDPTCADAWAGLSGVVPILAEKREYLQRALELEPANADIAASLRYVE